MCEKIRLCGRCNLQPKIKILIKETDFDEKNVKNNKKSLKMMKFEKKLKNCIFRRLDFLIF